MRTPRSPSPSRSRLRRLAPLVSFATVAGSISVSADALAFGGSARDFDRQGNFVVSTGEFALFDNFGRFSLTNDANAGLRQKVNSPTTTEFELRPALDYFIADHLSVGGAVEFDFFAPGINGNQNSTAFRIAPDVGYDFPLSGTWSIWPQAALAMQFFSYQNPVVTLVLTVPFLVHPAEHFFFGFGPGFGQDLTANANTFLTAGFVVGGYFDH